MRALAVPLHPKPGSEQLLEVRPLRNPCHHRAEEERGLPRPGSEGTSLTVGDAGERVDLLPPSPGKAA